MNPPPKQIQHEQYRQVLHQANFVRHGREIIIVTFMHEETVSVQPQEYRLVMDIDVAMTLNDAEQLAKTILDHVEQAKAGTARVEVIDKDKDRPERRR